MNPKCIDKDQKDRCPVGQADSTPTKSKPGKCAPDPEPDKKCDNQDTYLHKAVGPGGKLKKSCRLSREKEQKKLTKTNEKVTDSAKKLQDEKKAKTDEKIKQERKEKYDLH
jgi:hypothetical protein